jgi:hypothetical protein
MKATEIYSVITELENNVINREEALNKILEICKPKMLGSKELIGEVHANYTERKKQDWHYPSYYHGWLEGRLDLITELRE